MVGEMMKKNYFLIGGIIGSFITTVLPPIYNFKISYGSLSTIPMFVFNMGFDALSYLVGFALGGLIGYFIKR